MDCDVVSLSDEYKSLLSICSLRLSACDGVEDVHRLISEYDDIVNAFNEAVFLCLELGGIDAHGVMIKDGIVKFKLRLDELLVKFKDDIKKEFIDKGMDDDLVSSILSYIIDY